MTDTIQPALTPHEWIAEERLSWQGSIVLHDNGIRIFQGSERCHIAQDDFHGLAAFCLHGQPFGFTQEDVDRLHMLREEGWPMATIVAETTGLTDEWAMSLASRIAALLPPKL